MVLGLILRIQLHKKVFAVGEVVLPKVVPLSVDFTIFPKTPTATDKAIFLPKLNVCNLTKNLGGCKTNRHKSAPI